MRRKGDKNDGNSKEEEQFQVRYIDLERVIEVGNVRQFQQLANHADLNELQNNNKPFVFYTIERDDKVMLKLLLDCDIALDVRFMVDIASEEKDDDYHDSSKLSKRKSQSENRRSSIQVHTHVDNSNGNKIEFNALEYAKFLNRHEIADIIAAKLKEPPLIERWIKIIDQKDIDQIKKFKEKIKSALKLRELLQLGLIRSSQKGFVSLVDHFLVNEKVNVNCQAMLPDGSKLTPLLNAIEYGKNETAKNLIFRGADINTSGKYGDALVTAIHFDMPVDFIQLLLDKGASLASRHKEWHHLTIREFCIQFSKVKAKLIIDEHVIKLIANGEYEKLKTLSELGYRHFNIKNRLRKEGRQIAVERYHKNIVQLIDEIEEHEKRFWMKYYIV